MDEQPTPSPTPMPEPKTPMPTPGPAQPAPGDSTNFPQAQPNTDPAHTMAIAGLVLAFLMPLIGLVVSIVAHSKAKKAGVKSTLSTVGIILSAVFTLLSLAFVTLVILTTASGVQQTAKDNEAKTDINYLKTSISDYYDTKGYYPNSLSDVDVTDKAALTPPSSAYEYTYVSLPVGCGNDCSSYTLSVNLSDGSFYSVSSTY